MPDGFTKMLTKARECSRLEGLGQDGARYDKPGRHTGDTKARNHVTSYSEGQRK